MGNAGPRTTPSWSGMALLAGVLGIVCTASVGIGLATVVDASGSTLQTAAPTTTSTSEVAAHVPAATITVTGGPSAAQSFKMRTDAVGFLYLSMTEENATKTEWIGPPAPPPCQPAPTTTTSSTKPPAGPPNPPRSSDPGSAAAIRTFTLNTATGLQGTVTFHGPMIVGISITAGTTTAESIGFDTTRKDAIRMLKKANYSLPDDSARVISATDSAASGQPAAYRVHFANDLPNEATKNAAKVTQIDIGTCPTGSS